ncbi:MAG: hypothetical protein ACXACO_11630 [Promethearchaeota archaeon]
MINSDNYRKIPVRKNHRKKFPYGKNVRNIKILKFLDEGLYAQEIVQKISLSQKKLSIIINSFKERGLIMQIKRYPKIYKLTNTGKLILVQGDLQQRKIQEYIKEEKIRPNWIKELRVHKLRFKNKLIHKPSWLSKVRNEQRRAGFIVKRVELKNWTKFLLTFNYQDFDGLEKIEVCNNVIIYNFNRIKNDQYVSSKEGLRNYINDRIEDCKKARAFVQRNGFIIDNEDPAFCQNPHFAAESHGDPKALGTLGQYLNISIKTPSEIREVDDSPKTGGEEETDNIAKAESIFDVPDEIRELKTEISELKEAMKEMANGIKEMASAITTMVKPPEQTIPIKTDPGMFR